MKQKILLLILLIIGLFFIGCRQETEFQISTMWQYTSGIINCGSYSWIYGHSPSIIKSDEAVIGNYKITTEVFSSGIAYEFKGCKSNDCLGQQYSTDGYDCPLYIRYDVTCKDNDCSGEYYNTSSLTIGGQNYRCDIWNGTTTVWCPSSCSCISVDGSTYYYSVGEFPDIHCIDHRYQQRIGWEPYYDFCGGFNIENEICGGADLEVLSTGEGCYSKHNISYKDEVIFSTPDTIDRLLHKSFKEGQEVNVGEEDIQVFLHKYNQYYGTGGRDSSCKPNEIYVYRGCKGVENRYSITIPDDSVIMELVNPKLTNTFDFQLDITNDYAEAYVDLEVEITITYTLLGTEHTYSENRTSIELINIGDNEFPYSFQVEVPVDTLSLEASFELLASGDDFSGINYFCYKGDTEQGDVSNCKYIKVGTTSHIVDLNISNLCNITEDCPTPCKGKTVECINGRCVYGGECISYAWLWWLLGIIGLIILLGILAFVFRKKLF